jgi:hypothetical protein
MPSVSAAGVMRRAPGSAIIFTAVLGEHFLRRRGRRWAYDPRAASCSAGSSRAPPTGGAAAFVSDRLAVELWTVAQPVVRRVARFRGGADVDYGPFLAPVESQPPAAEATMIRRRLRRLLSFLGSFIGPAVLIVLALLILFVSAVIYVI